MADPVRKQPAGGVLDDDPFFYGSRWVSVAADLRTPLMIDASTGKRLLTGEEAAAEAEERARSEAEIARLRAELERLKTP
jgi:hypothetical protein